MRTRGSGDGPRPSHLVRGATADRPPFRETGNVKRRSLRPPCGGRGAGAQGRGGEHPDRMRFGYRLEPGARPEGRAYTLERTFVFGNPPPLHHLRRTEGRSPGGACRRDVTVRVRDTVTVRDRDTVKGTGGWTGITPPLIFLRFTFGVSRFTNGRAGGRRTGGWGLPHLTGAGGRASHLPASSFVSPFTEGRGGRAPPPRGPGRQRGPGARRAQAVEATGAAALGRVPEAQAASTGPTRPLPRRNLEAPPPARPVK